MHSLLQHAVSQRQVPIFTASTHRPSLHEVLLAVRQISHRCHMPLSSSSVQLAETHAASSMHASLYASLDQCHADHTSVMPAMESATDHKSDDRSTWSLFYTLAFARCRLPLSPIPPSSVVKLFMQQTTFAASLTCCRRSHAAARCTESCPLAARLTCDGRHSVVISSIVGSSTVPFFEIPEFSSQDCLGRKGNTYTKNEPFQYTSL